MSCAYALLLYQKCLMPQRKNQQKNLFFSSKKSIFPENRKHSNMTEQAQGILDLIEEGEHEKLDFKFAVNDAKKIARSLSAFANTKGGTLLIGVKDNGAIAGVRSEEELYMIEAAAQMHTKPEIELSARTHRIRGKTVLEVSILPGGNRPYTAPDEDDKYKAYIRIKDQNRLAHVVHYKAMLAERKNFRAKITYTEAEEFLLAYLSRNPFLTLKEYHKKAKISYRRALFLLSDFLRLEIIDIQYTADTAHFCLAEKHKPENFL